MESSQGYKMLEGTTGTPSYLMVAEVGGLRVGVRPLVSIGSNVIQFGLRVRVAKNPEAKVGVVHAGAISSKLFHDMPFQKVDEERASFVMGGNLPLPAGKTAEKIIIDLDNANFFKQVVGNVYGALGTPEGFTLIRTERETDQFLQDHLLKKLAEVIPTEQEAQNVENLYKSGEVAKVIQFPTKPKVFNFTDLAEEEHHLEVGEPGGSDEGPPEVE